MNEMTDKIDIIVGIPTYNEVDSIGLVTHKIDVGLKEHLAPYRCAIVNLDSDSKDGTSIEFLNTPTRNSKMSINTGANPRGKGKNLLCLFDLCQSLSAECIATIDGDIETVTPIWPKLLLQPILEGNFDYTVPIYARDRFEGNTTNHFAFPLLYGVLNADVRQPIGGEFGISRKLCSYFLNQKTIDAVLGYGIDIFMTTHAIGGGFATAEVFLGRKFHKPSFPKIVPMFKQVAHSALYTLLSYVGKKPKAYIERKEVEKRCNIDDTTRQIQEDAKKLLLRQMKEEFIVNYPIIEKNLGSLAKQVFRELKTSKPEISADMWTDVLTAVVKSCLQKNKPIRGEQDMKEIIDCITPIFIWRSIGTFIHEVADIKPKEVERLIQNQAKLFKKKWRKEYEIHPA